MATELELLDVDGNPLTSAARSSAAGPSGAGAQVKARREPVVPNLVWKEIEVEPNDIVIAKVTNKGRPGDFALGSKHLRVGVTNVNTDNPVPGLNLSAGDSGATVDLAAHVLNPDQLELTYTASIENPVSLGNIPVNVSVMVSGSVMSVEGPESGPAYCGPITLEVRVSDPSGLLHAVLSVPLAFTREESAGDDPNRVGLSCVDVRVTPVDSFSECSAMGVTGGTRYRASFTNNCSKSAYVRWELSQCIEGSPRYLSFGYILRIRPGDTWSPPPPSCVRGAAPTLRTCAIYSDSLDNPLCRDFISF